MIIHGMTMKELEELRTKWIKTIKVDDEVCITNIFNIIDDVLQSATLFDNNNHHQEEKFCFISKVRAILSNGDIVVDDKVYGPDGSFKRMGSTPVLYPPVDELRTEAWRYSFYCAIEVIDWKEFSNEAIADIINIINRETTNTTGE